MRVPVAQLGSRFCRSGPWTGLLMLAMTHRKCDESQMRVTRRKCEWIPDKDLDLDEMDDEGPSGEWPSHKWSGSEWSGSEWSSQVTGAGAGQIGQARHYFTFMYTSESANGIPHRLPSQTG